MQRHAHPSAVRIHSSVHKLFFPLHAPRVSSLSYYKDVLRPILFSMDPEAVHHLAMWALRHFGPALAPLKPVF
jgi:hypothetical protein